MKTTHLQGLCKGVRVFTYTPLHSPNQAIPSIMSHLPSTKQKKKQIKLPILKTNQTLYIKS
jgi:hypothetical protein